MNTSEVGNNQSEPSNASSHAEWRIVVLSALAVVVMSGMVAMNDYRKSFAAPEKLRKAMFANACVSRMVERDLMKPVPLAQGRGSPEVFDRMLDPSLLKPEPITHGRLDEMMGECKRLVKKSSEQDLNQEALERQRSALVGDFGK